MKKYKIICTAILILFTVMFTKSDVYAAASVETVTSTSGSAQYDPDSGTNTQDYYNFTYLIGDTSKTTANDSNTATITKYNICNTSSNCTIPATVKVKYNNKTYLLKVTAIGDGYNKICNPSGAITVGNNVKVINKNAFNGASYASKITIGKNVTTIDNYAFSGCSSATSLTFNANSVCTSIGSNAFYNCKGITSVTIPDSVTSIGSNAFYWCEKLNTVTIGKGVITIGSGAFSNAPLATKIAYNATSSNVTTNNAFVDKKAATVTIGSGVVKIPSNFIKGNTAVKTITLPSTLTSIESNAFYGCTALTAITIPNNVTTIEDYAFYNCSSLATVTLGTGITTLRSNTFKGTTPLTTLTINSNISNHSNAFKGHTCLTTLKIGSSLTNIYANMFQGCPNLSKVDITGSNVTSIGAYAFEGCKKLNTKNAFDYAAFDASLSGAVGEYAFRFGGFTSGASAGLPSVSVSQTVVQDNNYFPTSGGIGKVTMNISASPATANEGKDYIVILDTTGSMNNKVNGVSKMETAKKSLQTFADTIMEENSENRIAIVHFRGNVDNDTNSAGYCYLDFTKDKSTITTKITNLKANAGGAQIVKAGGSNTNYRLGIIAALNVMQMRGAESSVTAGGVTYGASGGADRNTYVVFISDGAANAQTSYITPLSKILKAAADEIWSIGICVEDSGETTEYLKMINTTMYGQDLFIDFPSANLEAAMTDFLKQVVSMSTSSIYNTILTSVIQSNWTPYKDSSHVWSSGVTNSGQNVSANIGAMGKESKSYTFYVKLIDAYKTGTMTSKGTYNPIVTNNVHADYKVSGGIYEGQSKTALNTQQYTLPWYAYDVIYNGNGNTGGSTSNQVKIGGINLSLRNNGFTKTAYRFKEWNTKADGTGTKYESGTSYSTNADLTLYAIWEPDTTYYTVKHWKQNIGGNAAMHDTSNYTEVTADRQTIQDVTIGSSQSPAVKTYTGFTSPAIQTVTIAANGATVVNYYYTRNNYTVTYIDVVEETGKELSRQTKSEVFNSTVRGSDLGSSTADNAYYNNYRYLKDSGVITVGTGENIVYRYFKWISFDIRGTVSWNDNSNKYQTRPDTVTVRLYRDGVESDSVTVNTGSNVNTYSFADLPKYDPETGRAYVYTVSQDTAYSQAALDTTEDKYTTTQDGYNFLNTISNTNKPEDDPDDPDDKGFYVSGNIYWNDKDDKLGFRPNEVTITLYQRGEDGEWKTFREPVIVDSKNENHYLFDWLPKYWYDASGTPNAFEYKVEESFSAWYVKDGEMVDAYTITPDNPNEFDFTNTLYIVNPDIPVSEYSNTLVIKTNTEEEVRVILKPQKPIYDEDLNVTYGDYSGNDVTVFTDNAGTVVDKLSPTRYEIVIDSTEYTLDDIKLSLPQNVELENIGGKWYVTIGNQPEDAFGTIEIELTKKEDFYQDRNRINNYFKTPISKRIVGGYIELPEDRDVSVVKKMSLSIAKPGTPVTVEYMDSLTKDVTLYSSGEQAEILDFLGVIPTNTEFIGWSTVKESETAEYLPGDMVTVGSENIVLYPVFKENSIVGAETETDNSEQLEESIIIETVD